MSISARQVLEVALGGVLLLILAPYFNSPEAVSRSLGWLTAQVAVLEPAQQGLWVAAAVLLAVALLVGLLNWLNYTHFSNVLATHSDIATRVVKALVVVALILGYVAMIVALCVELGAVGLLVIIPGIAVAWKAVRRAVWRLQHPLF